MSMCYWLIQGIGVNTNRLKFNDGKLKQLIREQFSDDDAVMKWLNEHEFDISDYICGCFDSMADLLTFCDDTDTMTYAGNGDGDEYFYYPPSMPWELTQNDPLSCEEVHRNIIKAVQKVTDMTAEEIEAVIDDNLYEVGCG